MPDFSHPSLVLSALIILIALTIHPAWRGFNVLRFSSNSSTYILSVLPEYHFWNPDLKERSNVLIMYSYTLNPSILVWSVLLSLFVSVEDTLQQVRVASLEFSFPFAVRGFMIFSYGHFCTKT